MQHHTTDLPAPTHIGVVAVLTDRSISALAQDPAVLKSLQEGVDAANAKLSRVEQIKKFAVLPDVWLPGSDNLTATGKLKRKPIATNYAATIESLYG
ncbi:fatty-acid--CoA ligase [Nocardia seriolae]|nr:fatty-acid--CoA ligase [Nocardia seriolae]QOW37122.1 fatty-acid--CoA ligase [Nocardia seriolae]QUN21919.1 fatty-acid--CoA ligase [Nocardia seriolae]